MTIRYNREVATVKCGGFVRLLLRWEGSIYKLLWFELCVFLGLYAALSLMYHFVLPESSKRTFETMGQYCNKYSDVIPISFVLGFYVQRVINRFWEQFNSIPWPNRMAIYVSTYIQTNDERGRLMRRTIMRYICLAFVMTMSSISPQIKKRFPTLTHMTEAGFLLANEQQLLEKMTVSNNKYFVPFVWATSVVAKARKEGKIKSDLAVQKLLSEINDFRGGCSGLFSFDWVSIPLGYTQVVSLAVYIFCLCCLLGRYQFEVGNPAEKHFPFFTILQFVFYMGWLKVAESGLSPFGEDDDDFDINLLVDRYLHESYMIVDDMFMKVPDMLRDQHWDVVDFDLPYTEAAAAHKKDIFLGSAMGMQVPAEKQAFVSLETSHANLKNSSSTRILSAQNLRSKKAHKVKKIPTLLESTDSRESVMGYGIASSSKTLEVTPKPVSHEELSLDTSVGQQPVEPKPSTSAGQQPNASAEQQPNASAAQQPSASAEQQPSASAEQQPTASLDPQASMLTQQESVLMAKIQDELRELRSK